MRRVAEKYVGAADADDIVHEGFLRAWRQRSTFRGGASIDTWIQRIVTNACIDELRVRRRHHARALDSIDEPSHSSTDTDYLVLRRAMNSLDAEERALCHLHYWQGYTYDELAAALGIPIGTVKSRLFQIRSRLRTRILRGHIPQGATRTPTTA